MTNSPGENSLTTAEIDRQLNDVINNDFPYAIKIDQLRNVYTFYTSANVDRYPLDVNYDQAVRAPVYFDGVQGGFWKDRSQFFNLWPKLMTQFQPVSGDGSTQTFSFTIQGPFLAGDVILGGTTTSGSAFSVTDDGANNLYLATPNPITSTPSAFNNSNIPGMYNRNLDNPGLLNYVSVGTVDYLSGAFSLDFTTAGITPASGELITVRVAQYQPGKPYTMLFWNNEFTIRPVPDAIHKVEVETFLTPVQFMSENDHPILNQWWKCIAYYASCEIQRERNDFESVNLLMEGLQKQIGLVLERQSCEEIGQPNFNLFNSTVRNPYLNNFWGMGFY